MSLAGLGGTYAAWGAAGLLIAIVVLVAIRWVYRKYRKRKAWAMINAEREDNKTRFMRGAEAFATISQQLQTNSVVLESLGARTDISQGSLAGYVGWNCGFPAFIDNAWQTIRRRGLTTLMQPHELHEVEELYTDLDILHAGFVTVQREIEAGSRHAQAGSSESGSQWLANELGHLQAIQIAHEKLGADMRHFHQQHTDFVPSV